MKRLLGRAACFLGYHLWNRNAYMFKPGELMGDWQDNHVGNIVCKRCETIRRYPFDFI
jgi:hypothetical protein